MRVLYLSPMVYGTNQAVDVLCRALESRLAEHDVEMFVEYADFAHADWPDQAEAAVARAVSAGVDAIVIWVVDPEVPARGVSAARASGIPVVTLERPRFPVDAAVVYPNFNHGVYMAEHLASLLRPAGRVGLVGGPDVVDDIELMLGLRHGLSISGLQLVNDPENPRYKNVTDVASGGYEMTANLLADFPDLDGLIPYNDETALGAVKALAEDGRLGQVMTVSRNGTPTVVELVKQGLHHGTWDIEPIGIGRTVADLVIRLIVDEENLDGLCVASPIGRMISQERVTGWIPWTKQIPERPLRPASEL